MKKDLNTKLLDKILKELTILITNNPLLIDGLLRLDRWELRKILKRQNVPMSEYQKFLPVLIGYLESAEKFWFKDDKSTDLVKVEIFSRQFAVRIKNLYFIEIPYKNKFRHFIIFDHNQKNITSEIAKDFGLKITKQYGSIEMIKMRYISCREMTSSLYDLIKSFYCPPMI